MVDAVFAVRTRRMDTQCTLGMRLADSGGGGAFRMSLECERACVCVIYIMARKYLQLTVAAAAPGQPDISKWVCAGHGGTYTRARAIAVHNNDCVFVCRRAPSGDLWVFSRARARE